MLSVLFSLVEVHGSEDPSATKLVFVMGSAFSHVFPPLPTSDPLPTPLRSLNASSFAWRSQVAFFASQGNNFSILVYDNRGSGNSSAPGGFYSTKAMARDGVALLDHLGWNAERSLVVVGASMGGMISMDLVRHFLFSEASGCGGPLELASGTTTLRTLWIGR